jgi:hypothetical protein
MLDNRFWGQKRIRHIFENRSNIWSYGRPGTMLIMVNIARYCKNAELGTHLFKNFILN